MRRFAKPLLPELRVELREGFQREGNPELRFIGSDLLAAITEAERDCPAMQIAVEGVLLFVQGSPAHVHAFHNAEGPIFIERVMKIRHDLVTFLVQVARTDPETPTVLLQDAQ